MSSLYSNPKTISIVLLSLTSSSQLSNVAESVKLRSSDSYGLPKKLGAGPAIAAAGVGLGVAATLSSAEHCGTNKSSNNSLLSGNFNMSNLNLNGQCQSLVLPTAVVKADEFTRPIMGMMTNGHGNTNRNKLRLVSPETDIKTKTYSGNTNSVKLFDNDSSMCMYSEEPFIRFDNYGFKTVPEVYHQDHNTNSTNMSDSDQFCEEYCPSTEISSPESDPVVTNPTTTSTTTTSTNYPIEWVQPYPVKWVKPKAKSQEPESLWGRVKSGIVSAVSSVGWGGPEEKVYYKFTEIPKCGRSSERYTVGNGGDSERIPLSEIPECR